jgi:hypothetical protein
MQPAANPKSQAPTSKQAPNSNIQFSKQAARCRLDFGNWSMLGTWFLGFGPSTRLTAFLL